MKKIISLLLVLAMVFAVVACGTTPTTAPTTAPNGTTNGTTGGTNGTTGGTNGTSSTTTKPTTPTKTEFDENNIVLTFAAISDIHLEKNSSYNTEAKFQQALTTLLSYAETAGNILDSVVIVGDICEKKDQIATFKAIYEGMNIGDGSELFFTLGNHDQESNYSNEALTLQSFKDVLGDAYFQNAENNFTTGDRYKVIEDANGKKHHFIVVQPASYGNDTTGNQVSFAASTVTWLDTKLAEITAADPNAYVYVFAHAMIENTCYGSELTYGGLYGDKGNGNYWSTSQLTSTLEKYPQVITFSGHLHFPINDERSIMQDKFTSIGTGSVAYLAIENGYSNTVSATVPQNAGNVSSGHVVEVDGNGNVRIVRLNLETGENLGNPWVLNAPQADKSHLNAYSAKRSESNAAPSMEGVTPAAAVNTIGGNRVAALTFAAGTDDNFVHHYEIKVTNTTDNKVEKEIKWLTDFYLHSDLANMAKTYSVGLGAVTGGKTYKVEITAVDSWGAKSATVSGTFTVDATFDATLPEPLSDIEFNADGTATDKKGVATVTLINGATISAKDVYFNGVKKSMVGLHAVSTADTKQSGTFTFEGYDLAKMDALYNGASGFSFEAFYVNRTKSGTQGIFCATEYGGLGFAEKSSGVPGFCVYGSTKKTYYYTAGTEVSDAKNLTHVICTAIVYENNVYTAIYVNGERTDSQTIPGKVWMTDSRYAAFAHQLSICNDIGNAGFPTTNCTVVDIKVYDVALNPEQVKTAFNNAKALFN